MGKKRVLVGYGVDVDAAAGWLNTSNGAPANPTNLSRGIYGATVGLDRLLTLFARHNIRATFFTPAHTLESFPRNMSRVRDAGHEMGLHGYTHEHVGQLSAVQQADVLAKSIEVLTQFCGGKRPEGYTAPAWATSRELIPQLQAEGVLYDHSFMHHDFQMYYAPDNGHAWTETDVEKGAASWMRPMGALVPSDVVEIPANWHLDDWPPLNPSPGRPGTHGFVDTAVVERLWREQFEFAYREYDEFVFPMSIHPQVSGKGQVVMMHERMIEFINSHEGVEWMSFGEMAKEFREGRMPGVQVEGGVDL